MNDTLAILIAKKDLSKLKEVNIIEQLVEWGGEIYSREPRKYDYKTDMFFYQYQSMDMNYYRNYIEDGIRVEDYVALHFETTKEFFFSRIWGAVSKNQEGLYNNELVVLIRDLYETLDKFYIVLLRDEEIIDEKYIINDANDAVQVFLESFRTRSGKGIVITKK